MRRVLVDLLFFTGTKGGMESYVREVYSRLTADDPELEYLGYRIERARRHPSPVVPRKPRRLGGERRGPCRVGTERTLLGRTRGPSPRCRRGALSREFRSRGARACPVVLTVHDLLAFRHPEYVPGAYARILRTMIRLAARSARRILTVSRAIARRHRRIPRRAGGTHAGDPAGGLDDQRLRTRAPIDADLLLAVGNRMPHKGFETLLEALAESTPTIGRSLVITGSHGDDPLAPLVERLGLDDHVDLRGWLSRDELDHLYAESTVLVFPTRFEGFGLPPLEAMARGCPVIVSDLPVLREVAGDAAVYVDPADPEAIARAIRSLLDSPAISSGCRRRASTAPADSPGSGPPPRPARHCSRCFPACGLGSVLAGSDRARGISRLRVDRTSATEQRLHRAVAASVLPLPLEPRERGAAQLRAALDRRDDGRTEHLGDASGATNPFTPGSIEFRRRVVLTRRRRHSACPPLPLPPRRVRSPRAPTG